MIYVASAICMLLSGLVAAYIGHWAARKTSWGWSIVAGLSFLALTLVIFALNSRQLSLTPPFSWLTLGIRKWVVLSTAVPALLFTLAVRLPQARTARALRWLAVIAVLRTGVLPAMAPLTAQDKMRSLKTIIDPQGVCLQGTSYTCGPASAVTALRRLGINAEESELALLCGTSDWTGTPDDILAAKLRERYGAQGLIVKHRYFEDVQEFTKWPVALVVVKFGTFIDHYLTVFEVGENTVTIGDPLVGRRTLDKTEFESKWRHVAILLRRSGQ